MNTNPLAKRILCYGDSNTWGIIPGSEQRHPTNKRWTGILQNQLGNNFEIIEEGLPGRTTNVDDPDAEGKNGAAYLTSCIRSHYPVDLVILMLGTNDLKKRYQRTLEQIAEGITEVVEIIENVEYNYNKKPQIILLSPPIIDETTERVQDRYSEAEEKSRQLAPEYQKVAEKYHCQFINTAKYIESSKIDGYHLDALAHQQLADILTARIQEML